MQKGIEAGVVHHLELEIDHAILMPDHKNWRSIASSVESLFRPVMERANPKVKFGYSSAGNPVSRFVAAVVPMITGEKPEIGNVANYLKRQRKRRTGTNEK